MNGCVYARAVRVRVVASLLGVVVCVGAPARSRAQPTDVLVRVVASEHDDDVPDILEDVVTALRAEGARPVTSAAAFVAATPVVVATREDLAVLEAVERALATARAHASELDEARALREVSLARTRYADALVAMPDGRVFLAELEIALALIAFQLGDRPLAEASLARAIGLDPRRRLLAADADPDFVARADALLAASERRPRETLVVDANVPAQVFVDDVYAGATPARVDVRSGLHVVRVVSALHAPYATLLPVERDLSLGVVLAPRPAAVLIARLERALDTADFPAVAETLVALGREGRAFATASVHGDLVVICRASGCTTPMSLAAFTSDAPAEGAPDDVSRALLDAGRSHTSERGRALRDRRHAASARRVRRNRILGIGAGLLGAAVVTAVGLAVRPTDEQLRVDVTFD